jgi:hypothetical protein
VIVATVGALSLSLIVPVVAEAVPEAMLKVSFYQSYQQL